MTSVESDPRSLRDHPTAWLRFSIMQRDNLRFTGTKCVSLTGVSFIRATSPWSKHCMTSDLREMTGIFIWSQRNRPGKATQTRKMVWIHTQEGKYKLCNWRNCTRLCFHFWLAQDSASDLLTHEVQLWPQLFPQMLTGFLYPFSLPAPAQKEGLMQVHQWRKLTRPRPLTEN